MAAASIATVVIGRPLVDLAELGIEESEVTLRTTERFLPRILVEIKWFSSISEVRKNRTDLVKNLDTPDFLEIRIGKRFLWLVIGE